MSALLSCPDPAFAGGPSADCPYAASTSAAGAEVCKETWVSFWAAGLLDSPSESAQAGPAGEEPRMEPKCFESEHNVLATGPSCLANNFPKFRVLQRRHFNIKNEEPEEKYLPGAKDPFCGLDFTIPDDTWQEDQLSSQLYRNKQLQDTLLQKEEELARLHEENNNLRQYLNSAVVKCLEDKAKKLLLPSGKKKPASLRNGKRKFKEGGYLALREMPHPSKARRNLLRDFIACEEQAAPAVDTWVLQTLGLKDIDTIDESLSANYSALPSELGANPYCPSQGEAMDYCNEDSIAAYGCAPMIPITCVASPGKQDLPYNQPPRASSVLPSGAPFGLPYFAKDVSPNKTDVAFTTSLSPHRNVKTHTFQQGQAFVRRDEDGGWKFTWVPKQAE
ncbi:geminin coiled-coil domain-containing protein 1 isoform X1 [Pelodiscus sinensis]|uniref:geminin coiled-coil domain-containing protein 1 isoform X1 n=1 Tax=Pelodiscus sinensis TaxID=13735 RepID=UPI003F6BB114